MSVVKKKNTGVPQLVENLLDKGIGVHARVKVNISDVELLEVDSKCFIASFKTAARIGLSFPKSPQFNTSAWSELTSRLGCPMCGMETQADTLDAEGCPWCGWNMNQGEDSIWRR